MRDSASNCLQEGQRDQGQGLKQENWEKVDVQSKKQWRLDEESEGGGGTILRTSKEISGR